MVSRPAPRNVHDSFFRRVFEKPANAASLVRALLPPAVVERLDVNGLTQVPGSFVDPELQQRHTDFLFSVPCHGTDGGGEGEVLVHVLVEHQSSSDRLMPWRMLNYVTCIWQRYLKNYPDAVRLPAVIPLVVHHNRRRWSAPTAVDEIIDLPLDILRAVGDLVPRMRFVLDDLATTDAATLKAQPLTVDAALALWLLTVTAENPRLVDDLRPWAGEMASILDRPRGVEDFQEFVTYIESAGEATSDELHTWFAELGPQAEEAYMTTADMLRTEGRSEGRSEGRVEGRAETLIRQLTFKFGDLPATTTERIHSASRDQLDTWALRVLTADTLDDALR